MTTKALYERSGAMPHARRIGAVVALVAVALGAMVAIGLDATRAAAAPSTAAGHPIPGQIPQGTTTAGGVTGLCYDASGYACAGDGYNGKSAQIDNGGNGWGSGHYWSSGSPGPTGDSRHNCTTYAAYRLQRNGFQFPGWTDHAFNWDTRAWAKNPRVQVDQTPAVGAIAQWNVSVGHVAYVEEYTSTYIVTTSDSYGGGTDRLKIPLSSGYMPDNFIHFKDVYEGRVVWAAGGARAVVIDGRRQAVGDYPTELCALYVHKRERRNATDVEFNNIPDAHTTYACNLNKTVLRASDKPEPKPSWAFHDGKLYAIQDGQTFQYLVNTAGYGLADMPQSAIVSTVPGRSLTSGGKEPLKLYAPNYVGKMLRLDNVDYVVSTDNLRHRVPNFQTMACGLYDPTAPAMIADRAQRHITGLFSEQVNSIPLSSAGYSCSLNFRLLRAIDTPDPKPSWAYHDGKKFAIPDGWTFDYYARKGWPVVDMPSSIVTNGGIPAGGNEPPNIDPRAIPAQSIINGGGIDFVIDPSKQRHRIPYIQDDVCWRNLKHLVLQASGLAQSQLDKFPLGSNFPCIIGPRMVKSDDGSSWYVDGTNTRQWIPDTDTYYQLIRDLNLEVVGPWPAYDVNFLPRGPDRSQLIDKEAVKNSLVCRGRDGHCWAVDGNGVRHFIPSFGDDVCFRWVYGWHVTRSNMNDAQIDSLGELEAWGCSMNGRVMATNEGPAYYMEGNTRRPIVDGYDYNCLVENGAPEIRGISLAEANGLTAGGAMPMCSSPHYRMVTIRSNGNGQFVSAEFGYSGDDYGMLRARSGGVYGAWETFRLVGDCNSGCGIQSAQTRQFVSAEAGYQGYAWGEMRARAGGIGGWETFRLIGDCNSGCGIWANANGRYVSAELDFTGHGYAMLRARAEGIGGWERFVIQ